MHPDLALSLLIDAMMADAPAEPLPPPEDDEDDDEGWPDDDWPDDDEEEG